MHVPQQENLFLNKYFKNTCPLCHWCMMYIHRYEWSSKFIKDQITWYINWCVTWQISCSITIQWCTKTVKQQTSSIQWKRKLQCISVLWCPFVMPFSLHCVKFSLLIKCKMCIQNVNEKYIEAERERERDRIEDGREQERERGWVGRGGAVKHGYVPCYKLNLTWGIGVRLLMLRYQTPIHVLRESHVNCVSP